MKGSGHVPTRKIAELRETRTARARRQRPHSDRIRHHRGVDRSGGRRHLEDVWRAAPHRAHRARPRVSSPRASSARERSEARWSEARWGEALQLAPADRVAPAACSRLRRVSRRPATRRERQRCGSLHGEVSDGPMARGVECDTEARRARRVFHAPEGASPRSVTPQSSPRRYEVGMTTALGAPARKHPHWR